MNRRPGPRDERAVSITVTHALTIGITTILISGLLLSAGGMLERETERSTDQSLETIGERLAGEIQSVDRMAGDDGQVNVTTDHPRRIGSRAYTVSLGTGDDCDGPLLEDGSDCVILTLRDDAPVYVPLETDADLETDSSVRGGGIEVSYDGDDDEIRLERAY
ncbi:DUF7266 family protein [Halopiger goleimassiliensis]|uniref:DUF7266 family protein n=1 Tax=Halopiger goleimassiliensis TaxID=1293048 RepID=UPI00067770F1|nr:hypothetical protein [Halopiger goleimassiliensis]